MIYKNLQIHNIGTLVQDSDNESVSWYRVSVAAYDAMDSDMGRRQCEGSTGVELRFVMKSDTVTLRMRVKNGTGIFHVYRGSIQGGWEDHEVDKVVTAQAADYVIKRSANLPLLEKIARDFHQPFSPEVVRVIFDRGSFELLDVIGEVEPPREEQLPEKTLLVYGSSITHGSNSLDMSHSWPAVLAHNLKTDLRNLGLAGSCRMEYVLMDYLADQGERDQWDMAVLELGINVLDWPEDTIRYKVKNLLEQIAGRNPHKPIFVLSPFYCNDDYLEGGRAATWRRVLEEVVARTAYPNVRYVNGLELLGDMSLISADEVHPNIYGVAQIADRLTAIIQNS